MVVSKKSGHKPFCQDRSADVKIKKSKLSEKFIRKTLILLCLTILIGNRKKTPELLGFPKMRGHSVCPESEI